VLFNNAGSSLFWLILLRNVHYSIVIQQLVSQQDPSNIQRLTSAFQELNQSINETVAAFGSDAALPLQRHGLRSRQMRNYKTGLMKFLLNVRGFLRIK